VRAERRAKYECASCGEFYTDQELCAACDCCVEGCCSCDLFDADELGLDPEDDVCRD